MSPLPLPSPPPLAPSSLRREVERARLARRGAMGWAIVRIPRAPWQWFWLALAVRFTAALLIHAYSLWAGYGGFYPLASGSDDIGYWFVSRDLYNGAHVVYDVNSYPRVLATYYHLVGGPDLLLGKLLNVLVGALSVFVGVMIVQELTRDRLPRAQRRRAAKWAGALLTFYPSLLWYSTQLVKDPILILLVMVALHCQLLFLKRARLVPIALWVVSLTGAMFFRPYAVAAVLLGLGLFVLRFNRKWTLPVVAFMALAPMGLGMGLFGMNYIAPMIATERLEQVRSQAYATGGSSVGIAVDYSSPLRFASTYSYSFATAMFGPFPWQIKALGQAIAFPEALGIWLLVPLWFRALARLLWKKAPRVPGGPRARQIAARDTSLLLFSLVLIGLVALFSDNIGANTRLRLLPWSAFFLFVSPYLARRKWKLF